MPRPPIDWRQEALDALWQGIVIAGLVFMGALALASLPSTLF